jgi:uncharacterized membrane protein YdbT with pleckstrin-like domain
VNLNIYLIAALVAAGILLHFLKKLHDLEQAGTILMPTTFIKAHPYSFLVAVLSAYLFAALMFFLNQLNYAVAILIGVTCGSAYDSLRARAAGKLGNVSSDSP